MVFRSFRFRIIIRLCLLAITIFAFIYLLSFNDKYVSIGILGFLIIVELVELFRYIEQTNRKLAHFLESIRYSDFISGFSSGKSLGKSFKNLDEAFNEVLEAFRKAREEKEEHWLYLNTVIQHINVGILSFEPDGTIGLINTMAKRYLNNPQIRNLKELAVENKEFYEVIVDLSPGKNILFNLNTQTYLAIQATEIRLKGRTYTLISLQNIRSELQEKEINAWQNLTRVLRHEIMNSITPIASLTSTLKEIIIEDLQDKGDHFELSEGGIEDLHEGLETILSRSKGLIRFIDAYREYTNIPQPDFKRIHLKDLLEHTAQLEKIEIRKAKVDFTFNTLPQDLTVWADEELLELVIINLLKNAIEAVEKVKSPKIILMGRVDTDLRTIIEVIDNGPGIIPEALDRIFIPFYSTKESGSGIGLALSRQIMQMHGGSLNVQSKPGHTVFTIKF